MSTAIGIGLKTTMLDQTLQEIESLAVEYGYGTETNLENAESDMKSGLLELFGALAWDTTILLKTPRDSNAALAFDIQEDLASWECEDKRPKFYDFLLSVFLLLKNRCDDFYIFFSGEWNKGDRIRMEQGYIEDMLTFLKRPAHWNEKLYVPQTGRYQYSDEVPLVYRVLI